MKKISVKFHTFGLDPPPLKSVKLINIFFSNMNWQTFWSKKKIFPCTNPQKLDNITLKYPGLPPSPQKNILFFAPSLVWNFHWEPLIFTFCLALTLAVLRLVKFISREVENKCNHQPSFIIIFSKNYHREWWS